MKTIFLLMAQFDGRAEIPLDEIRSQYLPELSDKEAKRRASLHRLPFPVHRLGSAKSRWMVNLNDLAAYIDDQMAEARQEWHKVNAA